MIYNSFDVVVVPFPFTDRQADKRRPALVLSDAENFNEASGNSVLAMITSQKNPRWPLDIPINHIQKTGLKSPSKVRMKIFTLDSRLIIRKIGKLSSQDKMGVKNALNDLISF